MCEMRCICRATPSDGYVVETVEKSLLGSLIYSDCSVGKPPSSKLTSTEQDSLLNKASRIPGLGIIAGIARMALAIIHTLGHLFMACIRSNKGHLYHTAKGASEFLRGFIEAFPLAGRIFASIYNPLGCGRKELVEDIDHGRSWWIIKIYNPKAPDNFDRWMNHWAPAYTEDKSLLPYTRGGVNYIKA